VNRVRVLARMIPALAVVGALAAAAFVVVPRLGGDDDPVVPPPVDIAAWPQKVRPFVSFVQEERNLTFRRVVEIEFLPPPDFEKEVTRDRAELSDDDREGLEQASATLRSLGLVDDGVDLFAESQRLAGAGVIGLYSPDDQRIRVRGSELTVAVRATLVHELTHALQDQYFHIGDRYDELSESDDDAVTAGASAYRALVEGDASRIETAYTESLTKRERATLDREQGRGRAELEARSKGIPPVLVTLLGAPYALGEALVDLAVALEGEQSVDDLFDDPPVSDEQLMDPWTLLSDPGSDSDAGTPAPADVPPVGDGEEELDSGTFGALSWYIVLAQRLDPRVALRATDGWGGDAYSSFERDGRSCVRIAFRGDTKRDVDEMAEALERWIAASADSALLQREGAGLVFASCESSVRARVLPQGSVLQLPVTRTVVARQAVDQGALDAHARCFGQGVIDELTQAELSDDSGEAVAKARAVFVRCAR
jgi:hypothetical protein